MTNRISSHAALMLVLTLVLLCTTAVTSSAQKPNKLEVEIWREVLRHVERELKQNYYDPTFNGIDIAARFKTAEAKMKNAADMAELESLIADILLDLNDIHTFFIPPDDGARVQYGWRLKPVGPDSYVGAVRPGSDAWTKGLRPGDKVLSIDGRLMDRDRVWLSNYRYYTLQPERTMTLVVQKPDQTMQQLIIEAEVSKGPGGLRYDFLEMNLKKPEAYLSNHPQFYELSKEVMVWRVPQFYLDEYALAEKFGRLKRRKTLILDLRGNSRGFPETLPHFAGYFFDSNVKLADRRGRKDLKPIVAKSKKENAFKGTLIVLIDGESASSAEIFARAVQLQKRGVVIGDRSAGSVMEGKLYQMEVGLLSSIRVAISATSADVILPDGTKVEHVGVTPDKLLVPTPQEMSAGHDPVLAYAASLAGIQLDPMKAGALFPSEWWTPR